MIKSVLIGLGNIGMGYDSGDASESTFLSHAKSLFHHPEFDLICGVDIDKTSRLKFESLFKRPTYQTLNDIEINIYDIDLFVIAVPTKFHKSIIEQIFERHHPKVILCEKPLAYTDDDAQAIIDLCTDNECAVFVNYIRRSDPSAVEIKNLIDETCSTGNRLKGVCWYTKGFLHNGSHFYNLLEHWLGMAIDSKIINRNAQRVVYDEEPDVCIAFERGDIIFLSGREEFYSLYSIEILFDDKKLVYDSGGEEIYFTSVVPISDGAAGQTPSLSKKKTVIKSDLANYQMNVYKELAKFMRNEPYALCSGMEALHTVKSMNVVLSNFVSEI
ncbi:MAG: Gfo/Idh/MocA family oxidoreductase [Burkholderiales bacterium]|nr:Gfo/Idh/MocA family oxidoreductase [Burkholderiales bacterium]